LFLNYSDGAQVLEIIPNVFSGEPVLFLLVGGDPIPGLFDRERRDARRLTQRCLRHSFTDMIDFRLVETYQFCLSAMRGFDQVAGLLHGNQIFVGRHRTSQFLILDFKFEIVRLFTIVSATSACPGSNPNLDHPASDFKTEI